MRRLLVVLSVLGCNPLSTVAPEGPRASLVVSCTGLVCDIDASASTAPAGIANYRIALGDGSTAWGQPTINYTYHNPGTYYISLVVIDKRGGVSESGKLQTVAR